MLLANGVLKPALLSRHWSSRVSCFAKLVIPPRTTVLSNSRSASSVAVNQQPSTMGAGGAALPAALEGLEPAALWRNFGTLSQIPRPSYQEQKVVAWLKSWAEERGLEWQQDAADNLVIRRPGSGGGEAAPPIVIQGHVDMVCEKNDGVDHDFSNDPIRLVREGDWITADGTTLGADNGIGCCCALAILELPMTAKLPPIEALFTVNEETGMTGAFGLDGSIIKGRTMLNLDTEEWPEVYIGCAGGGDSILTLELDTQNVPAGYSGLTLRVSGLMGGHSGINIHEDRGNALRLAAAVAEAALEAAPGALLTSVLGGDKRNAIARECTAVLVVPDDQAAAAKAAAERRGQELREEYGRKEAGLTIDAKPGPAAPHALAGDGGRRILDLLLVLPHGVWKNSHAMEGLVETSTNLASIKLAESSGGDKATFVVQTSTRSSMKPALEQVRRLIARVGRMCGASVEQDDAYPGWAPNPGAEIVQVAKDAISCVVGHQPEVKAIHAGLECGIIGERIPGTESVSYGPTIRGAHSPDERVQISTVKPFYEATLRILEVWADRRA